MRVRTARAFFIRQLFLTISQKRDLWGWGEIKLYSARFIGQVLDLTERRVRQLRDEGVLVEAQPGYYDLVPAIQAYIGYLRGRNSSGDLNAERARYTRAKCERQELDLAVRRGELYPADEIEQAVTAMLIRFKSHILSLPARLTPALCETNEPVAVRDCLRAALMEALEELSDYQTAKEEEDAAQDDYAFQEDQPDPETSA